MPETLLARTYEPDGICRVLALDGGGAKGFYTLGVLKEVEAMLDCPLHRRFDIVFGTSTGAIIAALIGLGYTVDEIHELYTTHVPVVMRQRTAVVVFQRTHNTHSGEGARHNERAELHAGVGGPFGISRNDRAHSDGLRAHAGHREACRCLPARCWHPGRRHAVTGAPGGHCKYLVGHFPMAATRPRRDCHGDLAIKATETGIAEKVKRLGQTLYATYSCSYT